MSTKFVRPAPVLDDPEVVRHIRDPRTGRVLPREGETVDWSDFWQRRQDDGDLLLEPLADAPPAKPRAVKPETPEKD